MLKIRIWDLLPFFTPGSGMGKNQDPEPGSGSGMNIPDHILESLETIFLGLTILKFFDADPDMHGIWDPESFLPWIRDPGWKKFGSRIGDKHPGSATLLFTVNIMVHF